MAWMGRWEIVVGPIGVAMVLPEPYFDDEQY